MHRLVDTWTSKVPRGLMWYLPVVSASRVAWLMWHAFGYNENSKRSLDAVEYHEIRLPIAVIIHDLFTRNMPIRSMRLKLGKN